MSKTSPERPTDCPHKRSDMTPCVITDGPVAYCLNGGGRPVCVGCGSAPFQTGVEPPPLSELKPHD